MRLFKAALAETEDPSCLLFPPESTITSKRKADSDGGDPPKKAKRNSKRKSDIEVTSGSSDNLEPTQRTRQKGIVGLGY